MTNCNKKNANEGFTNNNSVSVNAAPLNNNNNNEYGNAADYVAQLWSEGGTNVIIAIVAVLVVCLGIAILLTILGHKARVKCVGHSKYGFYSPLIITFLILMWLGNLFPPFTTAIAVIGFIGTIVMIVLANDHCKKIGK